MFRIYVERKIERTFVSEKIIFDFLNANRIEYELFKHQPVFTTEEKPVLIDSDVETIPGMHSKTLFLKDKNGVFFLVSVTEDKRVDLKALSVLLGCGRLSFGKPEELFELLKLRPGSVTPFGLIFDQQQKIIFILDKDFASASFVNFHPLRNDMTITLAPVQFLSCMEKLDHKPRIITVPVKEN